MLFSSCLTKSVQVQCECNSSDAVKGKCHRPTTKKSTVFEKAYPLYISVLLISMLIGRNSSMPSTLQIEIFIETP